MKPFLLSTLTLSLASAFAFAAEPTAPTAPMSGIAKEYMSPTVRAQDDFFTYMNGEWLRTIAIPADKSRWGTFDKLHDDLTPQLRTILEAAQKAPHKQPGSEAQKIGDLYASFMDEKRLNELGYKPLTGELQRIRSIKDKKALPALMAHLGQIGVTTPYAVSVGQDARKSTVYAVNLSQSGLGLPDRDYYLKKDDARTADTLAKYEQFVASMLGKVGEHDAAAEAKSVVALETALAQAQWTKVENRDPVKRYNKLDFKELASLTPGYDWQAAMAGAGVAGKADYIIVNQPSYLTAMNQVLGQTDLATIKAYLTWQLVRAYAPYLSTDFYDANFAFYGTVISGTKENQPRWKNGVGTVEEALGEAVGHVYVTEYFPAERKARMEQLVANVLAAYKQSIDTLDWMSPETKKEAQAKLAKFTPKIGYPTKWRDYSSLTVKPTDLAGNIMRANTYAYNRGINKLGKPIDRDEWGMTPQTVNAYYNPSKNEIVFPASILQPPFFDMRADDAVNYGAIGAVIGHEISHGFDDKGSQYDGDGNLRDWWTKEDRARFQVKTDALVAQYNGYAPMPAQPKATVNGELTLGENIGDNSGLAIAYKAYKLSLGGKPAPVIDGFTGDQRFFMGFGQVWRMKIRDERQAVLLKIDPHSPGQFRANGTVVNQPGFYEAFGVKPGDKMYVAPEKRVIIW